jgi:hypothetical protein
MHAKSIPRLTSALAAALLAACVAGPGRAATFPPLNSPATTEHRPCKLVWADLFTAFPAGAAKFYCELLGWTTSPLEQNGKGYTVFFNAGRPVAGLVTRSVQGGMHPSRWIGYYAVMDINSQPLLSPLRRAPWCEPRSAAFPTAATQAIISDRDTIPIGLLQSSSGDAPDTEPERRRLELV